VSRIEQSGKMSLRRPKPPIKGGSAPEEEEEEEQNLNKLGRARRKIIWIRYKVYTKQFLKSFGSDH